MIISCDLFRIDHTEKNLPYKGNKRQQDYVKVNSLKNKKTEETSSSRISLIN